jgi:hypothetical protein
MGCVAFAACQQFMTIEKELQGWADGQNIDQPRMNSTQRDASLLQLGIDRAGDRVAGLFCLNIDSSAVTELPLSEPKSKRYLWLSGRDRHFAAQRVDEGHSDAL